MNGLIIKRIDYTAAQNFLCCRLGLLGFSAKLIQEKCGLSKAQIYYRLKKVSIRLWDFRNGKTPISRIVIQRTTDITTQDLKKRLKPLLLHQ